MHNVGSGNDVVAVVLVVVTDIVTEAQTVVIYVTFIVAELIMCVFIHIYIYMCVCVF